MLQTFFSLSFLFFLSATFIIIFGPGLWYWLKAPAFDIPKAGLDSYTDRIEFSDDQSCRFKIIHCSRTGKVKLGPMEMGRLEWTKPWPAWVYDLRNWVINVLNLETKDYSAWKKDDQGRIYRVNKAAKRRNRDPYMRSLRSSDDWDYYELQREWEDEIEYKDEA